MRRFVGRFPDLVGVDLHLANGASHPWLFPDDGFAEGTDLDSVLSAIPIVIVTVSIILLRRLRRGSTNHELPRRL